MNKKGLILQVKSTLQGHYWYSIIVIKKWKQTNIITYFTLFDHK